MSLFRVEGDEIFFDGRVVAILVPIHGPRRDELIDALEDFDPESEAFEKGFKEGVAFQKASEVDHES